MIEIIVPLNQKEKKNIVENEWIFDRGEVGQ